MNKHEKNNIKKNIEIPVEQIIYDQRKIINQTKAIRRKRVIINKSLNIAFFLMIIATAIFLFRVLQMKDFSQISKERIFRNLQEIYDRNNEIIATHLKKNFLFVKETACSTFFSYIVPNFLYLDVGIKKIWYYIVVNVQSMTVGIQKFMSIILKNLLKVLV